MTPQASTSPFPGLRPFLAEETEFLFGRDADLARAELMIRRHGLLAVVGRSGTGKATFVRAGLVPRLTRQREDGLRWLARVVRPGMDPLQGLAQALVGEWFDVDGAHEGPPAQAAVEAFARRPGHLAERVNAVASAKGLGLLLVVDPFEELFRAAEGARERADAFVRQLLAAARDAAGRFRLVLSLRSEFIGECDRFPALSEAVSDGIFLLPRLSGPNLEAVIVGPLERAGEAIDPALVAQIQSDFQGDDQSLALLQHTLRSARAAAVARTPAGARTVISRQDYELIGGLRGAVSHTAEAVLAAFAPGQHLVAEAVFRGLGVRDGGGSYRRRPMRLSDLAAVANAGLGETRSVVEAFAIEGLLLPPPFALTDDSVVDLAYEQLLSLWPRLAAWVEREDELARRFRKLVDDALAHHEGRGSLYRREQILWARALLQDPAVNAAWASLYADGAAFRVACEFVQYSTDRADMSERRMPVALRPPPARNIFISYRRDDSGFAAYAVYKALAARFGPERVFFDLTSIPIGTDFKDRIRAQIDASAVMLVVIGDQWLDIRHKAGRRENERRIDDPDDHVRFEVETAIRTEKRVIPVLVGMQGMASADRFPPSLRSLAGLNAAILRFGPDLAMRSDRLVAEIGSALPGRRLHHLIARQLSWWAWRFRLHRQ